MNETMNQQLEQTVNNGWVLLKKEPARAGVDGMQVVREGSTGRAVNMLPRVWAVADPAQEGSERLPAHGGLRLVGSPQPVVLPAETVAAVTSAPKVEVAFYRKYTEAMLRRYLKLSMEAGRVPSLLGREMFRGNVTSYRVTSFEDVVIFCHDVENCLKRLNAGEQDLIRRIAMQEYSQAAASALLGTSLRSVVRRYAAAIDRLTGMFLERRMLEPLKGCQ